MKYIITIFICYAFCAQTSLRAQNISVDSIHPPNWEKVLQKAEDENKLIFLDCGASWCGPCKKFASEILTIDSVAQFFNKHFINVYADLDSVSIPCKTRAFGDSANR